MDCTVPQRGEGATFTGKHVFLWQNNSLWLNSLHTPPLVSVAPLAYRNRAFRWWALRVTTNQLTN
jgi:hypothetical protein